MDGMNSNLPLMELSFYPIFRTNPDNIPFLAKIVHSRTDQLLDAPSSMGEIVQDEAGQDSLITQSLLQHSTEEGGFVAIAVGNTYSVSPIWPRHGTFKINDARIASFANISEVRGLDTKRMAWNGLFYTGRAVQCFQCGIEIQNLTPEKDSLLEHIQESPDCPFLIELLSVKSLNEYKAQIISSGIMSQSGHGLGNFNDVGSTDGISGQVSTVSDHNSIAQYKLYSVRLDTFAKWPTSMSQTPEQLAKAGFYYTGLQDVVRCFSCNGQVRNWDEDSMPWIEHDRRFPQCAFVQHVKGQQFIDFVRRPTEEFDEVEDVVDHPTFLRNNLMVDPPDLQHLSVRKDPEESNQLDTTSTQIVLQNSCSREAAALANGVLRSKEFSAIVQHKISYKWRPVLMVEEESGNTTERTTDPREATGKLSRIPTLVEPDTRTHADRGKMVMIHNGKRFRPILSSKEGTDTILRENKSLKLSVFCMKCKIRMKTILFLPCTHHCLCQVCAEGRTKCPVCYKNIMQKYQTQMI